MRTYDVVQGTAEWLQVRSGIPTASNFDRIITKSGKPSAQARKYMHLLLAERLMGHPVIEAISFWQGRGLQMEKEAVLYYEGIRELSTVPVGLCVTDDGRIGASPDRLVGDDGLLEIKVPAEHTHIGYLLDGELDQEYTQQAQGQLWVTERAWLDILSYHPEMPPALIHVERDEDFIGMLSRAVTTFSGELERVSAEARERGWIR